jgi:hypothetical protein
VSEEVSRHSSSLRSLLRQFKAFMAFIPRWIYNIASIVGVFERGRYPPRNVVTFVSIPSARRGASASILFIFISILCVCVCASLPFWFFSYSHTHSQENFSAHMTRVWIWKRRSKIKCMQALGPRGHLDEPLHWVERGRRFLLCIAPRFLCCMCICARVRRRCAHLCSRFWSEMQRNCTQNCCTFLILYRSSWLI